MASSAVLAISVMLLLFSISEAAGDSSVYDILVRYGLPKGLLPDCVKSYTLSEDDGVFEVELDNTCYVNFEYQVYYEKKITGVLKYGSITRLKGIQVKRLFLWFDVDEIRVDLPPSNSIYFQVGIINKKLSVGQFSTVHSCSSKVGFRPLHNQVPMLLTE